MYRRGHESIDEFGKHVNENVTHKADENAHECRLGLIVRIHVQVHEEPETAPRLNGEKIAKILLHTVQQEQPFGHFELDEIFDF